MYVVFKFENEWSRVMREPHNVKEERLYDSSLVALQHYFLPCMTYSEYLRALNTHVKPFEMDLYYGEEGVSRNVFFRAVMLHYASEKNEKTFILKGIRRTE